MSQSTAQSVRAPVTGELYLHATVDSSPTRLTIYDNGTVILRDELEWSLSNFTFTRVRDSLRWLVPRLMGQIAGVAERELHRALGGALFEAYGTTVSLPRFRPDLSRFETIDPGPVPSWEAHPVDKAARWAEIEARYSGWNSRSGLEIWADDPGLGKTTSTARGAVRNDRRHVVYLPRHENCQEFIDDENKPDGYLHLKGASQPRSTCCMRAQVREGSVEGCTQPDCEGERMCPVYNFPEEHPVRQRYKRLAEEIGGRRAHEELELHTKWWHSGECAWQRQFTQLQDAERVVTVHEYLGFPHLRDFDDHIVDDLQSTPATSCDVSAVTVRAIARTLYGIVEGPLEQPIEAIAGYLETLAEGLKSGRIEQLSDLSPPEIAAPTWVTERISDDHDPLTETLAWVNHAYAETVRNDLDASLENEIPLHLTAAFAAAAEAGLSPPSVRRAIRAPDGLKRCPRDSKHTLTTDGGYQCCPECGWTERSCPLTAPSTRQARGAAELHRPGRDTPFMLRYTEVPHPDDLPPAADTLILDATPTTESYARLFEVAPTTVHVEGDDRIALNASVTQIIDGQYHRSTITSDLDSGVRLRERIQHLIDKVCSEHDHVVLVGHKHAEHYFALPENAEWIGYYAGRGLDRPDADALLAIGAPHPNVPALCRTERLLSIGTLASRTADDRIDSSGRTPEWSEPEPERDSRSYLFDDGTGQGVQATVKGYSGFLGDLFEDMREKELIQMIHRVRPAVADDQKEIYILTNVPLDVPVDTLASLSELVDPTTSLSLFSTGLTSLLPVLVETMEGTIELPADELSRAFERTDSELRVTVKDIHALTSDAESFESVSEQTIRNWLTDLEGLGLVEKADTYVPHVGYPYTVSRATSKGALSVIRNKECLKLHHAYQIRSLIVEADSAEEWVEPMISLLGVDESGDLDVPS